MDAVYQWIQAHQLIMGLATPIFLFLFGLIFAPAKVIKWGFLTSQFVRRFLGAKAEKEFEKAIDEFEQGLHSDDQDKPTPPIVPLLFGLLLFGACQVQAKEIFNSPFGYLTSEAPAAGMSATDGIWFLRPVYAQSFIKIRKSTDGDLDAIILSGTGIGVAWTRDISVGGKYYTSFSLSANGLFSPIIDGETLKAIKFSGSIIIGTQLPVIGVLGAGLGFDGKSVTANIAYSGKIF